jgi:hypothetical protein
MHIRANVFFKCELPAADLNGKLAEGSRRGHAAPRETAGNGLKMMKTVIMAAVLFLPSMAVAGAIERACLSGNRQGASRALCSCIQEAADATLTLSEQRKAAKFFKDPQKAQDTRQSDNSSNENFWKLYKNFGLTAESYCAPPASAG